MKDRFEPEELREKDPTVMFLIVNETLGMSIGKTAAQTAHAAQYLMVKYFELRDDCQDPHSDDPAFRARSIPKLQIMKDWLNSGVRKIVLKADSKEWIKIKEAFPEHILVCDFGLTEIPSGSETVIGLWPMKRSEMPKIIKRLQVLT